MDERQSSMHTHVLLHINTWSTTILTPLVSNEFQVASQAFLECTKHYIQIAKQVKTMNQAL